MFDINQISNQETAETLKTYVTHFDKLDSAQNFIQNLIVIYTHDKSVTDGTGPDEGNIKEFRKQLKIVLEEHISQESNSTTAINKLKIAQVSIENVCSVHFDLPQEKVLNESEDFAGGNVEQLKELIRQIRERGKSKFFTLN